LHEDLEHLACHLGRNLHGCLVGFQHDQALLHFDHIADSNVDLYDLGVFRAADIRHLQGFFCHDGFPYSETEPITALPDPAYPD
jgi:hypothetical protein